MKEEDNCGDQMSNKDEAEDDQKYRLLLEKAASVCSNLDYQEEVPIMDRPITDRPTDGGRSKCLNQ